MQRARPGTKGPISAEAFNAFAGAVDAVRGSQESGGGNLTFTPQGSIVRMRNDSGGDVPLWGVMRAIAPIVLPSDNEQSFLQQVMMTAGTPQRDRPAFAALEPVKNGNMGSFLAPGHVVPIKINKPEDTAYALARPDGNRQNLLAIEETDIDADDRIFDLLWHEEGSGIKWALVLMPGIRGPRLTVIGPCAAYIPAAELPDTDFDVVWATGCDGPSRVGVNVRNVSTNVVTIEPAELQGTSPLVFSTDTFQIDCLSGPLQTYVVIEVSSLAIGGVVATVFRDSDDSVLAVYSNAIYSWYPMAGGNLQLATPSACVCGTLPYDLCLSIPTR